MKSLKELRAIYVELHHTYDIYEISLTDIYCNKKENDIIRKEAKKRIKELEHKIKWELKCEIEHSILERKKEIHEYLQLKRKGKTKYE